MNSVNSVTKLSIVPIVMYTCMRRLLFLFLFVKRSSVLCSLYETILIVILLHLFTYIFCLFKNTVFKVKIPCAIKAFDGYKFHPGYHPWVGIELTPHHAETNSLVTAPIGSTNECLLQNFVNRNCKRRT